MEKKSFTLANNSLGGKDDHLYHIGLLQTDSLKERFQDVKYVCMGGKSERMKNFAEYMYQQLGKPANTELDEDGSVTDISKSAGRYSMFKVGPIISASHGIGTPSLSIVLHEILKLLHYAKCGNDVEFVRLGTSGGLGLDPGTIVVTEQSFDGELNPKFFQVHCGRAVRLTAETSEIMRKDLLQAGKDAKIPVLVGNTMSTDDFFEGQARTDGAFCSYSEEDKMTFLRKAHDEHGVKNIEMESLCFAAMCTRAKVKCAVACVTILNRLERDDVTADGALLTTWQDNLFVLMSQYIKNKDH